MKELIKKILSEKDAKEGLHVRMIAERILMSGASGDMSIDEVLRKVTQILNREVKKKNAADKDFARVKNPKTGKFRAGVYKLRIKKKEPLPIPIIDEKQNKDVILKETTTSQSQKTTTNYMGKAGEYAVMSELLFRGYNANNMSVDEGVDIVASKDNVFFFVQVKATELKGNYTAHTQIKVNRFDAFINTQIRYIIVVRCKENNAYKNIFFTFSNSDIEQFKFHKCVNTSDDYIYIKIRFDVDTHKPVLYHENKSLDMNFFMNRFQL